MKGQSCFWHKKYLLPRRSKSHTVLLTTSTSVNSCYYSVVLSTSAKSACLSLKTSWKAPQSQSATCQGLTQTLNQGLVSKC